MRRLSVALILSVFSAIAVPVGASSVVQPAEHPYLLQFVHDVADVAGLQPLPEVHVPPGASEVRIWTGFGVVSPEHLLILKIRADGTRSGRALSYERVSGGGGNPIIPQQQDECVSTSVRQGIVICDPRAVRQVDWDAVIDATRRLGVASLPDESQLPATRSRIKDGVSMLVEVKEAGQYRAYAYSNPNRRGEPQAQAAAEIIRVVHRVFEGR